MHELSIALSIIDGAEQELLRNTAVRRREHVTAVHLRIGPLAGVVSDALIFSFDIAAEGTLLEGARLVIEEVPIRIYCQTCAVEQEPASMLCLRCTRCGGSECSVTQGDELELAALELEVMPEEEEQENVASPISAPVSAKAG